MKNAVFWDGTPCGSLKTDVSEESSASIIRAKRIELGTKLALTSNFAASFSCYLLLTLFVLHRFVTLMMEELRSSETSVLTRATRRNIPQDGTLPSQDMFSSMEWVSDSPVITRKQDIKCYLLHKAVRATKRETPRPNQRCWRRMFQHGETRCLLRRLSVRCSSKFRSPGFGSLERVCSYSVPHTARHASCCQACVFTCTKRTWSQRSRGSWVLGRFTSHRNCSRYVG
jgi:hypothetical protein